jgi:hypothetical protein
MQTTIEVLLPLLDKAAEEGLGVIPWGSPVPTFGDPALSLIATVGLNPSNREFMDASGEELSDSERRFHTLRSLGLRSWPEAGEVHTKAITECCYNYFRTNPYETWFRRLDTILSGASASYFGPTPHACHLDLIPFATTSKWTELTSAQKSALLELSSDVLGCILRESAIEVLLLNGASVAAHFQRLSKHVLKRTVVPDWSLPRRHQKDVAGHAFSGRLRSFNNVPLGRDILVLGYNHNIQSSFGVTTHVIDSIRNWVNCAVKEALE